MAVVQFVGLNKSPLYSSDVFAVMQGIKVNLFYECALQQVRNKHP